MSSTADAAVLAFDRVARDYERTRPIPHEIADSIARHIATQLTPAGYLLDAGCGTGRFTRPLVRYHDRVVGVDAAPAMLAELKRLHSGESPLPLLLTGDLRALPFVDAQFGAVLSVHVLHLIADWRSALSEMWRVLALGGTFFLGHEDREPSAVRDFYFSEGKRLGLLPAHPGTRSTEGEIFPALNAAGAIPIIEPAPAVWEWKRTARVRQMLADLEARLYSSQWGILDDAHQRILHATYANAQSVFGSLDADPKETTATRFLLHAVHKC